MNLLDAEVYSAAEISKEKISTLIATNKTFILSNIDPNYFRTTTEMVVRTIKSKGLTCQIYFPGRITTMAEAAVAIVHGLTRGLEIAACDFATLDPDYEIREDFFMNTTAFIYRKQSR